MTCSSSEKKSGTFCTLPWTGILSVQTNLDVTFCPCFLKMKLGNLKDSSLETLWNTEPLQDLRRTFKAGRLPDACKGQLCPVVMGRKE